MRNDFLLTKDDPSLSLRISRIENILQNDPDNLKLVSNLLTFLDCQAPNVTGRGPYSECQRQIIAQFRATELLGLELSKQYLYQNFPKWHSVLTSASIKSSLEIIQCYQGEYLKINDIRANCKSYLSLFNTKSVIHHHCFDCFKVQILPESVVSLILVYFVMMKIVLPRNNRRKCMIELREAIRYPYKGYIFCQSEQEALTILKLVKHELESCGINDINYAISHGCSEFGLKYPAFKYCSDGSHRNFETPKSWDVMENSVSIENKLGGLSLKDQSNESLTLRDMICFDNWVQYAKIIGDSTYKTIVSEALPPKNNRVLEIARNQADTRKLELEELYSNRNMNLDG